MALNIQNPKIEITAVDKTKAAFESVKNSFKSISQGIESTLGSMGGFNLSIAAIASGFALMVKNTIDAADAMNDLSKRTGISVEQLSAWELATQQSGTSIEALANGLGKASKYMVAHADNLKRIGIDGKTAEEVMLQLAGVISKLPADDPRRVALAMEVLGKSAGELIPLLSEGEEGLRKMLDKGRDMGGMTSDLARKSDEFNDKLAVTNRLFSNIAYTITNVLLDPLNYVLDAFAGDKFDKIMKANKAAQAGANDGLFLDKSKLKLGDYAAGPSAEKTQAEIDKLLGGSNTDTSKENISEKIRALAQENQLLAQGVSLEDARTISRLKAAGATDEQIVQTLNYTNEQSRLIEAEKASEKAKQDLIKANEDHAAAMQKLVQTQDDLLTAAEREYEASQRNLLVQQLGESSVIRLEAARLQEAAASAEQGLAYARLNGLSQENIDFTESMIVKMRQLAEMRLKIADSSDANDAFEKEKRRIEDLAKAQQEALQNSQAEAARAAENMNRSITDALLRGFESGKGFAKNFRDTLINMFKTLVLQPIVKFLVDSSGLSKVISAITGVFSTSASASSEAGVTGIFGGLKDIFTSGNNSIVSSIESLGATIANGNGGILDSIGGFIGQNSSAIADGFSYLGAAMQLSQGNLAGAALTAVGTYFGGPLGGAIGSFLGSALGGLFGGTKKLPRYITSVASEYSNGVFSSNSPTSGADSKGLLAGAADPLRNLNAQFSTLLGSLLSASGLNDAIKTSSLLYKKNNTIARFAASFEGGSVNYDMGGKNPDPQSQFNNMVESVLGTTLVAAIQKSKLSAGIKAMFDGLTKKEDIAATINTIVSIQNALIDLPPIFKTVSDALNSTVKSMSVDQLKNRFSAISNYTNLFYSDAEKFDYFTNSLLRQFSEIGAVIPGSREEFRKLVDGLDTTTASGLDMFNALVDLAPSMDAYYKGLQSQKDALDAVAESMRPLEDAFANVVDFNRYNRVAANNGAAFADAYTSILPQFNANPTGTTNAEMVALLNKMIIEIQAGNIAIANNTMQTSQTLRRWNGDGMPETRVVA